MGEAVNFNGQTFTVLEEYDSRNNAKVFKLRRDIPDDGELFVLKIQKEIGGRNPHSGRLYSEMIDDFVLAQRHLNQHGVDTPEIFDHIPGEAVLVEFVDGAFDLEDFLSNTIEGESKAIIDQAEAALYRFAESTSLYMQIGDFHMGQLVYDKQGDKWIMIDSANHHVLAEQYLSILDKNDHAFSKIFVTVEYLAGVLDERLTRIKKEIETRVSAQPRVRSLEGVSSDGSSSQLKVRSKSSYCSNAQSKIGLAN